MLQVNLPAKPDMETLEESIFEVLDSVGMMFQDEELLRALEAAGARVDYAAEVARFPKSVQRAFVEAVRHERAGAVSTDSHVPYRAPSLPSLETQVAQFVYDYDAQERRPGNREEFIELIKFGEALHGDAGVGHCLLLRDVPPLLEPIEAGVLLAEYARHPHGPFAWNVAQEPYLQEMAEILGRSRFHTFGAVCPAHPLRFDRAVAGRYVRMMRSGHAAGLTAMPTVGVSAPVTIEGFLVVSAAELLATWIAGRALAPSCELGGAMWAATLDMRTGQASFTAFDAVYYDIACVQFVRKWCGVEIAVGTTDYGAAKAPGLYAVIEKAYRSMTVAAFTGRHYQFGQGMLDSGKVLSDVQLLLERDFSRGLQQYARLMDPTEESVALPTILEIGVGIESNHFQTDHTARHFRQSLWMPELLQRTGWSGFAEEKQLLDETRDKAKALVASYRKPDGRDDQIAALRKVADRARRELL
jgi:trimethylamine--corrinoid protein Co-methyltransferase